MRGARAMKSTLPTSSLRLLVPVLLSLAVLAAFVGLVVLRSRRLAVSDAPIAQGAGPRTDRGGPDSAAIVHPGALVPRGAASLKSPFAAPLLEVFVRPGQVVKKGDLLARLDASRERALLARAEAVVAEARAQVEKAKLEAQEARLELDRTEKLKAHASEAELQNRALAVARANAHSAAAEARLKDTLAQLEELRLQVR